MNRELDSTINNLELAKKKTKHGIDYWTGREIQEILGYLRWENFVNVINKARMACESTGVDPSDHFLDTTKEIRAGKGARLQKSDYFLTRYACYLVAMNGNTEKPEIGTAQSYFAVQTHRQEKQDKLTEDERRIMLRDRVKDGNKKLASAAKKAGVKTRKFPIFQDAGYRGLYDMSLSDIKKFKGLSLKDDLLDRSGRTELAANEFRITQTEDKLIRENVNGEDKAINTHKEVGRAVRNTIKKLGGIMPEKLLPEPSLKKLENKLKKEKKKALAETEASN